MSPGFGQGVYKAFSSSDLLLCDALPPLILFWLVALVGFCSHHLLSAAIGLLSSSLQSKGWPKDGQAYLFKGTRTVAVLV